jgi:hypothetical protein
MKREGRYGKNPKKIAGRQPPVTGTRNPGTTRVSLPLDHYLPCAVRLLHPIPFRARQREREREERASGSRRGSSSRGDRPVPPPPSPPALGVTSRYARSPAAEPLSTRETQVRSSLPPPPLLSSPAAGPFSRRLPPDGGSSRAASLPFSLPALPFSCWRGAHGRRSGTRSGRFRRGRRSRPPSTWARPCARGALHLSSPMCARDWEASPRARAIERSHMRCLWNYACSIVDHSILLVNFIIIV